VSLCLSRQYKIDGFDIFFDPFVLRKNKHYVVEAFVNGPESCFGKDGMDSVECHGVTFCFSKPSNPEHHNVRLGQLAEFFFKPI